MTLPKSDQDPLRFKSSPSSAKDHLRRIERLARKLIGPHFREPNDLWHFQEELLAVQRSLQESITATKSNRGHSKEQRQTLQELRWARWHARRLGDAFAWLLLGLDKSLIHSLSENKRVPIPQDDHGSRGLLAIASWLGGQGWGFPLLHDITDCLRIGDITLVKPAGDSLVTHTIEVKTRLVAEQNAADGKTSFQYQVTVVSTRPFDSLNESAITPKSHQRGSTPAARRPGLAAVQHHQPNERTERQLQRMAKAEAVQQAQANTLIEFDGQPIVSTMLTSEASSHWKLLRRIIRDSRRVGYASELVEKTFLYAAFYDSSGVTEETVKDERLINDIKDSGLLQKSEKHQSAIVIHQVPPQEGQGPQVFLPYFLYSIPQRAILDVLHGRLIVLVLVNPAPIATSLENRGFKVSETGRNEVGLGPFSAACEVTDDSGNFFWADLRILSVHVHELIYEFRSSAYLMDAAESLRGAAKIAISRRAPAESEVSTR